MFKPFITFNEEKQRLMLHDEILNCHKEQAIHFINVIEIKESDLNVITKLKMPKFDNLIEHGIYTSPILSHHEKNVCLLYLPQNMGRVEEKIHDFLASVMIFLSNVCLFDVSSKFLRQSNQFTCCLPRFNYLTMHSSSGEIFKVQTDNNTTKLELSSKVAFSPEQKEQFTFPLEFSSNAALSYTPQELKQLVKENQPFLTTIILNNYLSFEKERVKFFISLRIHDFLKENSQDYVQLCKNKEMLTINQIIQIEEELSNLELIEQFQNWKAMSNNSGNRVNENLLAMILKDLKKNKVQTIKQKNQNLKTKLLRSLKSEHFSSIESHSQLFLKKQVSESILLEYGIDLIYLPVLTNDAQLKLQCSEIKRLSCVIYEKEETMQQLTKMYEKQKNEKQYVQKEYESASEKICTFKHINSEFLRVTEEYQKQRQKNRQNKIEIDSLMIYKDSSDKKEEILRSTIVRATEEKQAIEEELSHKRAEIDYLEEKIKILEIKNNEKDDKLLGYVKLQSKAWGAIEKAETATNLMQNLKRLSQKFNEEQRLFKEEEVKKFNYILQRNYESFEEVRQENRQKEEINKSLVSEINSLRKKLEEQRIHSRYCQDEVMKIMRMRMRNGCGPISEEEEMVQA